MQLCILYLSPAAFVGQAWLNKVWKAGRAEVEDVSGNGRVEEGAGEGTPSVEGVMPGIMRATVRVMLRLF